MFHKECKATHILTCQSQYLWDSKLQINVTKIVICQLTKVKINGTGLQSKYFVKIQGRIRQEIKYWD
jgi:hypothetical protein